MADFKEVKELVAQLLVKYPELRDDDNKLLAQAWFYLHPDIFDTTEGKNWLSIVGSGELVRPDTITRARRKLQEKVPGLRGVNYKKRKDRAEEVRKNIDGQGTLVL